MSCQTNRHPEYEEWRVFWPQSGRGKIWELLQSQRSVQEILNRLVEEYPEVDRETCTRIFSVCSTSWRRELIES